jgi:hypothetical protein
MSAIARFIEAGRPLDGSRKSRKLWAAQKIERLPGDELARRVRLAKTLCFGSLWAIGVKHGKARQTEALIHSMLDRNEDARKYDSFRRIDACYVKFLPHRSQP